MNYDRELMDREISEAAAFFEKFKNERDAGGGAPFGYVKIQPWIRDLGSEETGAIIEAARPLLVIRQDRSTQEFSSFREMAMIWKPD